jgi:hypothetical protein
MEFVQYLLIILAVPVPITLGIGYLITKSVKGHKAAQRELYYAIRFLLAIFILVCLPLLFGESILSLYGFCFLLFIALYFVYSLSWIVWSLTWPLRKQEAGVLLLDVGRTNNKYMFWYSLLIIAMASFQVWSSFEQPSRGVEPSTSLILSGVNNAYLGIVLLLYALGKLEFRENGTCFMYGFITWERIKSYNWKPSEPNTLTMRFKPRYPLFPRSISMKIPAKYRDTVNRFLDEQLPGKNL